MNQKLISNPNQNDCCLEPKYYFTTYANYISKQHLSFLGEKNSMWFFRSTNQNKIHSFQRFYLNRQMKIIKKCQIELGIITFMNKSNQLIVQNKNAIQIWQLDNSNNWVFHKNITIFRGDQDLDELSDSEGEQFDFDNGFLELFECHELNLNDDLLVETGYQRNLQFWQRSCNDDNWICQQTIQSLRDSVIKELKLNTSGQLLIAYVDFQFKLIIFTRDQNDEQWKIIHQIQTEANYYFCFISNEIFAEMSYDLPILSLWKINLFDTNVGKFQDLYFQPPTNQLQYIYRNLHFLGQKDILIDINQGILYIIKKYDNKEEYYIKQQFQIKNDPINIICSNQEFLFLNYSKNVFSFAKVQIQSRF